MNKQDIEQYRSEHEKLLDTLKNVQNVGITTEEGCKIMLQFKDLFVKHLENENKNFYPVLYEAAKKNIALQATMDTFATEMEQIADKVFDFYEKLEKNCDYKNIARDFGEILSDLTVRVRREEKILFKEFEKL